jgi:ABC-type sugar transport system permease subunit
MGRGAAASVLLFAVIFVLTLIQKIMKDRKEDQ